MPRSVLAKMRTVLRSFVLCSLLSMPLSVRADIALSMTWVKHHCTGKPNPLSTVVAVATDAPNLLPIIAVINSTFSNAAEPDLVSMVVITRHVNRLILALKEFLPQYLKPTVICGGFSDLLMQRPALRKLQSLHNSTRVKRKELLSPFNFAAFYLPYVLRESKRVLYLDSDTVVRGDVGDLRGLDMQGLAAAAVEDCSQFIAKYIDYDMLRSYDRTTQQSGWTRWGISDDLSNSTCVFNRGVVLFDCERWRELRLTETIEDLVEAFVQSRARLWRGGISQPPFLLALAGRYLKLDLEWNVRGLGRIDLGRNEWMVLAEYSRLRYGTNPSIFERHMAPSGPFKHTFNPFLCPFAAHAKILHFNGELKPWMLSGEETKDWRLIGLNVSAREGSKITGTCTLTHCPTSVNISSGRRLRSACEIWAQSSDFTGFRRRWDQQRFSPDNQRWNTSGLQTVASYYAHGCYARPPLCTCVSDLSDDCITSCASNWHAYVSPSLFGSPTATAGGWINDTDKPVQRRLSDSTGRELSYWLDDDDEPPFESFHEPCAARALV